MKFTKMHGAGNDYVYVNCFEEAVGNPGKTAVAVSDRHFGIGGDGLVLICPSEVADVRMDMYNADGSRGKMCGNASRCVAKYVFDNGIVKKDEISLETLSGIKYIKVFHKDGRAFTATVNMGAPILTQKDIPTRFAEGGTVKTLNIGSNDYPVTCVSMGNPHCVTFVEDVNAVEIEKTGPLFENHTMFPDRINTEFVRVINRNEVDMRVWERGSGETLACGTGACATAVACVLNGFCDKDADIKVNLRGGVLTIRWAADGNVYMTGPAETAFTGVWEDKQ
ncbi:MAG: diaminopimelate epimerase [Clostridiales bacterium]|nr:diaminopimelate epimerase [Clostridiales bacterium]